MPLESNKGEVSVLHKSAVSALYRHDVLKQTEEGIYMRDKTKLAYFVEKPHGFGTTVALMFIALLTVIGVSLANVTREASRSGDNQQMQASIAILLKQSGDLQRGFARYVSDGNDISTSAIVNTALYTQQNGITYATVQMAPAKIMDSSSSQPWTINVVGRFMDTVDPNRVAIAYVFGLSDAACMALNRLLHEKVVPSTWTPDIEIPTTNVIQARIVGSSDRLARPSGWQSGCLKTSRGTPINFYFAVLS